MCFRAWSEAWLKVSRLCKVKVSQDELLNNLTEENIKTCNGEGENLKPDESRYSKDRNTTPLRSSLGTPSALPVRAVNHAASINTEMTHSSIQSSDLTADFSTVQRLSESPVWGSGVYLKQFWPWSCACLVARVRSWTHELVFFTHGINTDTEIILLIQQISTRH